MKFKIPFAGSTHEMVTRHRREMGVQGSMFYTIPPRGKQFKNQWEITSYSRVQTSRGENERHCGRFTSQDKCESVSELEFG